MNTDGTGMGGECPQISQMNADLLAGPTGCFYWSGGGRQAYLILQLSVFICGSSESLLLTELVVLG